MRVANSQKYAIRKTEHGCFGARLNAKYVNKIRGVGGRKLSSPRTGSGTDPWTDRGRGREPGTPPRTTPVRRAVTTGRPRTKTRIYSESTSARLRIRVAYMAYRRLMLHAYYLFENLVFVRTLKQCHGDLYRRRAAAPARGNAARWPGSRAIVNERRPAPGTERVHIVPPGREPQLVHALLYA